MMRNLISGLALAALAAAFMPGTALANISCPPGSPAPGCEAPETSTALTASFHGTPEAHNGKKLFAFEIRFSGDFSGLRLREVKQALQVTGGRVVDVKRTVRGKNGSVTVRVRPSSSGALTITLAAGTAGGGSLTVPGPESPPPAPEPEPATEQVSTPDPQPVSMPTPTPTPLTASFHGLPMKHDGKLLSFEIRFSEEFDGLKLTALKQALQVTGGRIVDVKRTVRGKNGSVTVRVRPFSFDPVGISLPATSDCAASGAICTKAGGMLSGSASANIISEGWGTPVRAAFPHIPLPPGQSPPTARAISSTVPSSLTSYTWGSVVNMNSYGIWGLNKGQIGSGTGQTPNTAPNFQVREEIRDPGVAKSAVLIYGSDPFGRGAIAARYKNYFYAYPSGTDTSKTRVILQIDKLGPGTSNGAFGALAKGGKTDLQAFVDSGGTYTEFFKVDAFLQEKGTQAQPDVTATFTGHVIAADSAAGNIGMRGELIGGDASVTATVSGGSVTADISLTNLKATTFTDGTPMVPVGYASQSWTGLSVSGGSFLSDTGDRKIQGSFRKQNNDGDANTDIVDTVGAVFDIRGTMTGGFVATK